MKIPVLKDGISYRRKGSGLRRILLNIAGFLAIGLGAVGIFLPLLPTTPFVLLAAGCFASANPKMYKWLVKSKYFGEYIRNFREKKGISTQTRVRALIFLWLTLSLSAVIFRFIHVWIILGIVGIGVSIHLLTLKGREADEKTVGQEVTI
jgi:uncharacterized membrane protein YbaN (DUF454 family)